MQTILSGRKVLFSCVFVFCLMCLIAWRLCFFIRTSHFYLLFVSHSPTYTQSHCPMNVCWLETYIFRIMDNFLRQVRQMNPFLFNNKEEPKRKKNLWMLYERNETKKKIVCLLWSKKLQWYSKGYIHIERESNYVRIWNEDVKQYYYISLEKIQKYFKIFPSNIPFFTTIFVVGLFCAFDIKWKCFHWTRFILQ